MMTPQDIRLGTAAFAWKINTDGGNVNNSSVKIALVTHVRPIITASKVAIPETSGIITRPLTNYTTSITHKSAKIEGAGSKEPKLPDLSRLIEISIRRSPFVIRVNTPKFSNGL